MSSAQAFVAADSEQRERALDTRESFVVTAPAGSGKTELLTQRLLRLLAGVEQPEQVLAITFTRKAAAEMRARVLGALALGEQPEAPAEPHRRKTWGLAREVIQRDLEGGWQLRKDSTRLRVQTIDSLCASIAAAHPLTGFQGGALSPVDDAMPLYERAVSSLLEELDEKSGNPPLRQLCDFYNGNLQLLAGMLANMLAQREQWLASLLEVSNSADPAEDLQRCLQKWSEELLQDARAALSRFAAELVELGDFAASSLLDSPSVAPGSAIRSLAGLCELPAASVDALPQWAGLRELLLTADGAARKKADKRQGFPAKKQLAPALQPRADENKRRVQALYLEFAKDGEALDALQAVASLPAASADAGHDALLGALAATLVKLCAHLQLVFAGHRSCDHAEVTMAALRVLAADHDTATAIFSSQGRATQASPGSDVAFSWHNRLRHILVDEYQDTSLSQYRLLCALTSEWVASNAARDGAPRTVFLVGDAMQSIYAFREARVQLFLQARRGFLGDLPLQRLDLVQNFRSDAPLVAWFNRHLAPAFPAQEDSARGGVMFAPAVAARQTSGAADIAIGGASSQPAAVQFSACTGEAAGVLEAMHICSIVQAELRKNPAASIAILVRMRKQLAQILPVLREAGIGIHGTDMAPLLDSGPVADCMLLARALLSLHDEIAWWSLLRSVWCGLTLADLQHLRDHSDQCPHCEHVPALLLPGNSEEFGKCAALLKSLGAEAAARLQRLASVLSHAWRLRARYTLREQVEYCWRELQGQLVAASAVQPDAAASLAQFFDELEMLEAACLQRSERLSPTLLQRHMGKLYATPAAVTGAAVQVMTIYKAKGLEFDVVILPALAEAATSDKKPLLHIGERVFSDGSSGILLYPKSPASAHADGKRSRQATTVYDFLDTEKSRQKDYEDTRLLYVAATRAKQRLYLTASLALEDAAPGHSGSTLREPAKSSLLWRLWPAIGDSANIITAGEQAHQPVELTGLASGNCLRRLTGKAIAELASAPGPAVPPQGNDKRATGQLHSQDRASLVSGDAARDIPADVAGDENWQRCAGMVFHELVQLILVEGPASWRERALAQYRPHWTCRLRQLGLAGLALGKALALLEKSLRGVLQGVTGFELLCQAEREPAAELELVRREQGSWRRFGIDLFYIDSSGVCQLVDFKVAQPAAGEALQDFLDREREKYRAQLSNYAALLGALPVAGQAAMQLALYYPLLDRLVAVNED